MYPLLNCAVNIETVLHELSAIAGFLVDWEALIINRSHVVCIVQDHIASTGCQRWRSLLVKLFHTEQFHA